MFSLETLGAFFAKSGLRKVMAGLYMFSAIAFLLYARALAGPEFVDCFKVLVLGLFVGNAAEHFAKKPAAPSAPELPGQAPGQ